MPPSATATADGSNKKAKTGSKKKISSRKTTNILEYIRRVVGRPTLLQLYESTDANGHRGVWTCRAVWQALSPVAQQVCLRLSLTGASFAVTGVQVWLKQVEQYDSIVRELRDWALLQDDDKTADPSHPPTTLTLTKAFQEGLCESLLRLDETCAFTALSPAQVRAMEEQAGIQPPSPPLTATDLERYTSQQWDVVLQFLVGNQDATPPPAAVVHVLVQTGLMQAEDESDDRSPLWMTSAGYDFMLQETDQQVWLFVTHYLDRLRAQGAELVQEALWLLLAVGCSCEPGRLYVAENSKQRGMIRDLALLGWLYTRKIGKTLVFSPTSTAVQLVHGGSESSSTTSRAAALQALEEALAHPRPQELESNHQGHLALIVQTNFQVCAYTTSKLHLSLLGLFCDTSMMRRLPNICFLTLTRDSVKSAFALGIKAKQIISFLEQHAHPQLRRAAATNRTNSSNMATPANVVDQIWLWEREQTRVEFTQVYQHQCQLPNEFAAVQRYCYKKGAHVWSSERQQVIYVDYAYVETVHNFVRTWRAQTAAKQSQR